MMQEGHCAETQSDDRRPDVKGTLTLVRRLMGALARNSGDLDDLVQIALLEIERSTFRGESQFATFAHVICHRVWCRYHKRVRAHRQRFCELSESHEHATLGDVGPSPHHELEQKREQERVQLLLKRLSDTQREALVLFYFEGLDAAQISQRSATRASTVHTRLRDGREALRKLLTT